MRRVTFFVVVLFAGTLILASAAPGAAQQKGQSVSVQHGVVVGSEKVKLKNNDALKGALVGGTIGYASTSGGSSSKKRRNTALGATAGGLVAAKPAEEGMLYTVDLGNGKVQVVTDQTEIHMGDCVVVEQSSKGANIRRTSPEVCDPASAEVVADLEAEFQEEAMECIDARKELGAAKTDADFDRALRKVEILCEG